MPETPIFCLDKPESVTPSGALSAIERSAELAHREELRRTESEKLSALKDIRGLLQDNLNATLETKQAFNSEVSSLIGHWVSKYVFSI